MAELKAATDRGVIVFNCSQCFKGSVTAVYQTGHVSVHLYNVLYGIITSPTENCVPEWLNGFCVPVSYFYTEVILVFFTDKSILLIKYYDIFSL